jgi:hypothetical protein
VESALLLCGTQLSSVDRPSTIGYAYGQPLHSGPDPQTPAPAAPEDLASTRLEIPEKKGYSSCHRDAPPMCPASLARHAWLAAVSAQHGPEGNRNAHCNLCNRRDL